jgi:hypothetical protein
LRKTYDWRTILAAPGISIAVSFCIFTALAMIGDLPRLMGRTRQLCD